MTDDIQRTLGELLEGQRHLREEVHEIKIEHRMTREMVVQHRTGWRLLVWLGGAALAVLAATKGLGIWGR